MSDPALASAAEQMITDAAYVVHAAAAKELRVSAEGAPVAADYAAVRALARRGMIAPVELFHDVDTVRADMIRYRGALRAIVEQHVPDPDHGGDPDTCMRCHDCAGEPMAHPCPTYLDATAALTPIDPAAQAAQFADEALALAEQTLPAANEALAATEATYASRHLGDPDPRDPGFCKCGLGLDAWVHTDTTHYRETPLGRTTTSAKGK